MTQHEMKLSSRCEVLAAYLIENNATVRSTASYYGISKSTVHKDLTEKLKRKNPALYRQVAKVLHTNMAERHLRGGEATRKKYAHEI